MAARLDRASSFNAIMAAKLDRASFFESGMGVLIPSPNISYTHAIVPHPFDPNALLTVKGRLRYLPEHAIANFPFEQQAVHYAGQSIVFREMTKVRRYEEVQKILGLPEIDLNIHQNVKVKPLENCEYWRGVLGYGSQHQSHRYVTFFPVKSRLLRGSKEKYIWHHDCGRWKRTTWAGVQEATERREWVCKELERVEALRYETEAEWTRNVGERYMAGLNKKRKSDQDGKDKDEEAQAVNDISSKRLKTVSFDDRVTPTIEPASKTPRLEIEPLIELPHKEIPDSQTTQSSSSETLSISPNAEYEVRSQAPEPESPFKETTADFLKRYSFVLDISATDGQRLSWIKFLEQYQWNKSLISSLRVFFMADTPPTTSQTVAFLKRLKAVFATIEDAESDGTQKKFRLFWDNKVTVHVKEAAAEATAEPEPSHRLSLIQPMWLSPPRRQCPSPTALKGKIMGKEKTTAPKTLSATLMTLSPTSSQVREAALAENVQTAMKKYVKTLEKGDKVEPPCDRCRGLRLKCHINFVSCQGCAAAHEKCSWSEVLAEEFREMGILQGEGTPTPAKPDKGKPKKYPRGMKMKETSQGNSRSAKKRGSIYEFPEDGDETKAFLEDEADEDADGNETRAFLNDDDDRDESGEDVEDEWKPSS